jgi:hypothetical protein
MKQVRKERQEALTKMLNFWYKYEKYQTPKMQSYMRMWVER